LAKQQETPGFLFWQPELKAGRQNKKPSTPSLQLKEALAEANRGGESEEHLSACS